MFTNKFRLFLGVLAVFGLLMIVLFIKNKTTAADKNRNAITTVLNNIEANAQTHYKRANSFAGWVIPASLRIQEIGNFREKVENKKVTIYVVGKEIGENGVSNVNIQTTITGNSITLKIRN